MYSRTQSRSGARYEYDAEGAYDEISDEEYELYRYNLPPKYDGSHFRQSAVRKYESRRRIPDAEDETVEKVDEETASCSSTETVTECKEDESQDRRTDTSAGLQRLLTQLGENFGREEMLIVALILILAGSGESCGDVILFLALLLTQH